MISTVPSRAPSAQADGPLDALVVGGGFYGCGIAIALRQRHGLDRVLVVERESELLARASYVNQARVHNGYHYPRSFMTAYRSRVNLPRFAADYADCIDDSFVKVYAIARRNSLVTARQFARFCREIGAPCEPAPPAVARLFAPERIEQVFLVREFAFDAVALRRRMEGALEAASIPVWLGAEVTGVAAEGDKQRVSLRMRGETRSLTARRVFNCTYAGLNGLGSGFGRLRSTLKHEITEMALLSMPDELAGLGVTVMDGPFFSTMPFPARGLHSLSHVRYTPHASWTSTGGDSDLTPYAVLDAYPKRSRAGHMLRDAARFLPALAGARVEDSLFEIKTVLAVNEVDDGRPILLERNTALPCAWSVLGGKIDNIYDIHQALEAWAPADWVARNPAAGAATALPGSACTGAAAAAAPEPRLEIRHA